MSKDNSLDKFVERYPTYIEALDMIDNLKAQLKTAQELLAKEMNGQNVVIDNLQKEMKTKLAEQRDHYENQLKSQPKEIVERIKKFAYDTFNEWGVFDETDLEHILDTILKEYEGE